MSARWPASFVPGLTDLEADRPLPSSPCRLVGTLFVRPSLPLPNCPAIETDRETGPGPDGGISSDPPMIIVRHPLQLPKVDMAVEPKRGAYVKCSSLSRRLACHRLGELDYEWDIERMHEANAAVIS